jgi:D-alanyl-lipoteichoic acid acyltransferase DltB (MBOAT superfamily)
MIFTSLVFSLFLITTAVVYYLLPLKLRLWWLLIASLYFYTYATPYYTLLISFLIISDYFSARQIEKNSNNTRGIWFGVGLSLNLLTLLVFKYFDFFVGNLNQIFGFSLPLLHWLLPLGLSFHVFQSLAYLIEVHRGTAPAEKRFQIYALSSLFFPLVVSGPIERPGHLLPQLQAPVSFRNENLTLGLERILFGLFKKLVIADNLALAVNHIYSPLPAADGPSLWLAVLLYTLQLYADFSAYTDIAIGVARLFGIELLENFDRPLTARSIAEFWRRWHITLSTWLRDYVYYPLALRGRKSPTKLYAVTLLTFALIGIWHGANWTYLLFGLTHGLYVVIGSISESPRRRLAQFLRWQNSKLRAYWQQLVTLLLVSLSLIFFRAPTLTDAWYVFTHLTQNLGKIFDLSYLRYQLFTLAHLGINKETLLIAIAGLVLALWVEKQQKRQELFHLTNNSSRTKRWLAYYALIAIVLYWGYFGPPNFIYFQF